MKIITICHICVFASFINIYCDQKNVHNKEYPFSANLTFSNDWKYSVTAGLNHKFKSPFSIDIRYNFTKHFSEFNQRIWRATDIDYWHRFKLGIEASRKESKSLEFFGRASYVPALYPVVKRNKSTGLRYQKLKFDFLYRSEFDIGIRYFLIANLAVDFYGGWLLRLTDWEFHIAPFNFGGKFYF